MIKKFLLLSILFLSLIPVSKAFAQAFQRPPGFDYSAPALRGTVGPSPSPIDIAPTVVMNIPQSAIPFGTQFTASKGIFSEMKKLLPQGQSPIASYYVLFYSSSGTQIFPSAPIGIEVFNNYTGTKTFVYPINSSGKIDTSKIVKYDTPVKATFNITKDDPAFIVAVDKDLNQSQTAIYLTPPPSSPNVYVPKSQSNLPLTLIILVVGLLAVALVLLRLLSVYLKENR